MARRAAIRGEGDAAETRFLELVRSARPSDQAKLGDAVMDVDGEETYVEIKECHAAVGRSGTINQVRAIKYIPCVIYAPNHNLWYVIGPDQLVALAAEKPRGQHTEIPFESMNLGLRTLPGELHTTCTDEQLEATVCTAIRQGRDHERVKELMQSLLDEIERVRDRYRTIALEILGP